MTNGLPQKRRIDDLFAETYDELRRLASAVKRHNQNATLNPTALVHEAWLKMSASTRVPSISLLHFKRIAARAMRQVLIDAARRRKAQKREAGDTILAAMEPGSSTAAFADEELLALDQALGKLAEMSPRQAAMVEGRFFGGLETGEIAELLEVSEATVMRDWRTARAWLGKEFRKS